MCISCVFFNFSHTLPVLQNWMCYCKVTCICLISASLERTYHALITKKLIVAVWLGKLGLYCFTGWASFFKTTKILIQELGFRFYFVFSLYWVIDYYICRHCLVHSMSHQMVYWLRNRTGQSRIWFPCSEAFNHILFFCHSVEFFFLNPTLELFRDTHSLLLWSNCCYVLAGPPHSDARLAQSRLRVTSRG